MDDLTIYFKPLGGQSRSVVERACYADIGVAVGDHWLTFLEDRMANSVSNHLRASVHQLGIWFASNWWRLRWEPEVHGWASNADWRIAHSMASAGGGFVWPNILFASDGDSVAVASRLASHAEAFEPVRYLNAFDGRISATEFENKVDSFLESVIARLDGMEIHDDPLAALWREVMEERTDPELTQWRKLEAMAGYDPDGSPEGLYDRLLDDQDQLGKSAVEEVAAEAKCDIDIALQPMREANKQALPRAGGYRIIIPPLDAPNTDASDLPWRQAGRMAAEARKQWNLGNKPILNKRLADLLETSANLLSEGSPSRTHTPFAVRQRKKGAMNVYLQSRFTANNRFALGRLIGDHLYFTAEEKLLPATRAGTSRQKFQRAFAQELLCPYDALIEKIQTDQPNDDDIEEAAKYFHVSPMLVKTALVNRGDLDRHTLGQVA